MSHVPLFGLPLHVGRKSPSTLSFFPHKTTLNIIVFSVTYYLESRDTTYVYYIFHTLPTNVKLGVWTLWNMNNFTG